MLRLESIGLDDSADLEAQRERHVKALGLRLHGAPGALGK
jgi:hypothetical protein